MKPERAKNGDRRRRELWWRFTRPTMDLYRAIADLDRVLVVARVSKTGLPVFIPTGQVMSEQTVVFASQSPADLALLSSAIHYVWALAQASSLKGDLRYTSSDVYETMPKPAVTADMESAGSVLDELRKAIMLDRQLGLTKLYSLVHDENTSDREIRQLREIHESINTAVSEAYGWTELEPAHDFYQMRPGVRFIVAPGVQTEILDRLLELNHARHVDEEAVGRDNAGKGKLRSTYHHSSASVAPAGGSSKDSPATLDDLLF